jgi:hypothetical protein
MEPSGTTEEVVEPQPTTEESTGQTEVIETDTSEFPFAPPVPDIITLEDILNDQLLKQQKEDTDKTAILTISSQSAQGLKPTLVQWAIRGFPAAYPIYRVNVHPPPVCLDGVSRSLYDYIVYLTGKPIEDHVSDLCCKVKDMVVGFANINGLITIVVSRS